MGVRFPIQQPQPDFGPMQQADNARQAIPRQQEAQSPGQAVPGQTQEPAEQNTMREVQEPQQALLRQTPAERAADDADAQTPGSIIDMLA